MSNDSDLRAVNGISNKRDIVLLMARFVKRVMDDKENKTPAEVAILPELIEILLERL